MTAMPTAPEQDDFMSLLRAKVSEMNISPTLPAKARVLLDGPWRDEAESQITIPISVSLLSGKGDSQQPEDTSKDTTSTGVLPGNQGSGEVSEDELKLGKQLLKEYGGLDIDEMIKLINWTAQFMEDSFKA